MNFLVLQALSDLSIGSEKAAFAGRLFRVRGLAAEYDSKFNGAMSLKVTDGTSVTTHDYLMVDRQIVGGHTVANCNATNIMCSTI